MNNKRMALAKLKHHYQVVLDCDLCESHDKVDWYCMTCPANLCEKCKILHTSRKNFKQHKVTSREEFKSKTTGGSEKTSVCNCPAHGHNELTLTCVTCRVPVCNEFIITKHNQHKFESLTSKLDKTKNKLSIFITVLEKNATKVLYQIGNNTEELNFAEGKYREARMDIIKARDNVKALADAESSRMLDQLDYEMKKSNTEVSKSNSKLKSSLEQTTNLIEKARSLLTTKDATVIDEFLQRNQSKKELSGVEVKLSVPKFQTRKFQSSAILGSLTFEGLKLKEVASCSPKPSNVKVVGTFTVDTMATEIRAISSTMVWCSNFDKTFLKLYQFRGKEIQSFCMDFKIQSFAPDRTGNLIVCDLNGQSIKQIASDGRVITLCNTKPQWPRGICLNHRTQPVVCMGDSLVVYSKDCRSKLLEVRYDQQGKPLFQRAFKVALNGESSYCVVDIDAKKVVTISVEGRVRWTYNGGLLKERFCPSNICCDKYNMVVIADSINHKIHLLAESGDFIMYIASGLDINDPCGLDISEDCILWISESNNSKRVHRVMYLSDT